MKIGDTVFCAMLGMKGVVVAFEDDGFIVVMKTKSGNVHVPAADVVRR